MINAALAEVTDRPLVVTFSVPGGQAMAAKTTNERLGILGGISILGTTGVVKPFSTASYRASVVQQIDVAAAQGHDMVVLATGSRSESYALSAWPDVPENNYIDALVHQKLRKLRMVPSELCTLSVFGVVAI